MSVDLSICDEAGRFVLIEFGVDEEGDIIGESDDLSDFLTNWNKDNLTGYNSRDDFNSGETKYYIKKLSTFTVSFSIVGNGSIQVYGRDEKDAKQNFFDNFDLQELLEVTHFDDGADVEHMYLDDEGDVFPNDMEE
jgi:subtilisin family serine protease